MHVTQIIKHIDYRLLSEAQILPTLTYNGPKTPKKFPPWVYSEITPELFGLYIDHVIKEMIICLEPPTSSSTTLLLSLSFLSFLSSSGVAHQISSCFTKASASLNLLDKYPQLPEAGLSLSYYEAIFKSLATWPFINSQFDSQVSHLNLEGHPDIFTYHNNCPVVLDIKTTSNFLKMSGEAYLQILSYTALLRQNSIPVKYAGLFLPVTKQILLYDIETWDSTAFLDILLNRTKISLSIVPILDPQHLLGFHISKDSSISHSLLSRNLSLKQPVQMNLRNPQNGMIASHPLTEIEDAKLAISNLGIQFFCHGAMCVNLANPVLKRILPTTTGA